MAVKNEPLEQALRQCKGKKMYFAFIPKGAEGQLIVSKKKVPEKDVAAARKEIGGGNPVRGKCFGPVADLVFQVAKEQPGTFKNALKLVAKRETGLTIVPNVQVAVDAETEEQETGETETTETGTSTTGTSTTTDTTSGSEQSGDPQSNEQAKSDVMKRLAAITTAFKDAIAANGPDVGQLNTLMTSFKDLLTKKSYGLAAKVLDVLEPLITKAKALWEQQKVVAKKAEVSKKITELEKDKNAAHITAKTTEARTKVTEAAKKGEAPNTDFAGALSGLDIVEKSLADLKTMLDEYQKVLDHKVDTDKKIDRLEKDPKKDLIKDEISAAKGLVAPALAEANPPNNDYLGAIKALAVVDKKCAAAEVKIFDELVKGKSRAEMETEMKKIFKDRFGVDLAMTASGDTQQQELDSMKRVYELMVQVPESHATNNPSLKAIQRTGGASGSSFYRKKDATSGADVNLVVLKCGRPTTTGTTLGAGLKNSSGNYDPPIEDDCKPRPGATEEQSYFDWTTLHEIAHAIDDKQGFMTKNGATAEYGGWNVHGNDVTKPAEAVAAHFNFNTPEALTYVKGLMTGAAGSRPGTKPTAPGDRPDWAATQLKVENYVDSIRSGADPWKKMPEALGSDVRIFHEAYSKKWVSYLKAARAQGIKGYQFRAPGEWFSELYAAYHCGVLKDSHPMVKKFLRDL